MAEPPDVVVLGDINVDVIFIVESLPRPGEVLGARSARVYHGGVGGNVATWLAKLGLRVALIGAVGSDYAGREVLGELERLGVDVSRVRVVEGEATGFMVVLVDRSGERTIVGSRGANSRLRVEREDLELAAMARHVHVSGYSMLNEDRGEGALSLLRAAVRAGVTTSVDLEGVAYGGPGAVSALRGLATYVTANPLEVAHAVGAGVFDESAASRALELLGARAVVVKLGAEGCMIAEPGRVHRVPAYKVEVVDTTGAGDAFNAGLIYGLLRGLTLVDAARLANAAGAYKCTGYGARHSAGARELARLFPDIARLLGGDL